MKKLLLTLVTLSFALGIYASTKEEIFPSPEPIPSSYTNVTPSYFKFYEGSNTNLASMWTENTIGASLGSSSNISKSTEIFTEDGLKKGYLLAGGAFFNQKASGTLTQEDIESGISILDMGEKIGKVLVINGASSNLKGALKTSLNLDREVPTFSKSLTGNLIWYWIYDYITMTSPLQAGDKLKVRVRIELNAYNNNMNQNTKVFSSLQSTTEAGTSFGPVAANNNVTYKDFVYRQGDRIEGDTYNESYTTEWNPYRWMVYEYEYSQGGAAPYLNMNLTNGTYDINNGALMIRSILVYTIPQDSDLTLSNTDPTISWIDYSQGEGDAGNDNPTVDPNYPTVNAGNDITPAGYKFGEGALLPIHQKGKVDNINLGNRAWSALESEKYWNDGLMIVSSGGGLNAVQHESFINSWNYIDFGGEVGRVACYINNKSTAIDDLKVLNESADWESLNKNDQVFGGGALNFYLDPKNTPTDGYIHAKVVFNVNDYSATNDIFQFMGVVDDNNNGFSVWNGTDYNENPPASDNKAVSKKDFTNAEGKWDPTKWMTYEFDFNLDKNQDKANKDLPVRLKMFYVAGQSNTTTAIFFKEISFTHVENGEPTMMGERYKKVETLEIGTPIISYIPEKASMKSIENDSKAGVTLNKDNFTGFETEENLWSNQGVTVDVQPYYSLSEYKNYELKDAVTVSDSDIVISVPDNIGADLHHGVVYLQTNVDLKEGETYDFSCNVSGNTRASSSPNLLIKLHTDKEALGVANVTNNGSLHYAYNMDHKGGHLILEVHFGGNAGQDIKVSDIVFTLHDETVGIQSIQSQNEIVEYYNLQGVKVVNPEKGLYIKKQGNKTSKVILK